MERKIGGQKHGMLDRELHRKHSNHWSTQTITAFWSGHSFKDPDGEISHLSYSLAEILVDLMVQEFPNFMEFVARADRTTHLLAVLLAPAAPHTGCAALCGC